MQCGAPQQCPARKKERQGTQKIFAASNGALSTETATWPAHAHRITGSMDILPAAIAGVVRAAAATQLGAAKAVQAAACSKADASPVTAADYAAQAIVTAHLCTSASSWHLIGEEEASSFAVGSSTAADASLLASAALGAPCSAEQVQSWLASSDHSGTGPAELTAWLDPLDGTRGFVRGGQWAVGLALGPRGGSPNIAVIAAPRLPWHQSERGLQLAVPDEHALNPGAPDPALSLASAWASTGLLAVASPGTSPQVWPLAHFLPLIPETWAPATPMSAVQACAGSSAKPWLDSCAQAASAAAELCSPGSGQELPLRGSLHASAATVLRDDQAWAVLSSYERAHSAAAVSSSTARVLGAHTLALPCDSMVKYVIAAAGLPHAMPLYVRATPRGTYAEKPWDHAPGSVLAQATGLAVLDVDERALVWDGTRSMTANYGVYCGPSGEVQDAVLHELARVTARPE